MMQKLIIEFGQDACEDVADNEKWIPTLFIWAGCGCHKDLNTVSAKGDYATIVQWWMNNLHMSCPIMLLNHDTASILEDTSGGES